MEPKQFKEVPVSVVLDEDVWLEAGKEYFVRGKVSDATDMAESFVFVPNKANLWKRELVAAHAIVDISRGYCPVRIICLAEDRTHFFKGTCLGTIETLTSVSTSNCLKMGKETKLSHSNVDQLKTIYKKELSQLTPEDQSRFLFILVNYSDVFSCSKFDIGLAQGVQHHINTGDAEPIGQNYRRVPRGVEDKVDELVDQLLKHNIIRPSHSPWNAPIVVVSKKNGDIRLCVDYRRLNAVTKRPIFPIPDAQQLFDALDGACWFSTLDLSQGYYQVPVAAEDIQKTAFTTRHGQFEYLRMPFGLCSAPATFQRLMHCVLQKENWIQCLIYLDDVLVFGRNATEHFERLQTVLERFREAGLKLSPEKCHLFSKEVTYLGHTISHRGIQTSSEKIEKIQNAQEPVKEEELRSFLGLSGYYRRFIKDYASIVAPLEKLCKSSWNRKAKKQEKKQPWIWSDEHKKAFNHLKWCLTHAPILCFPTNNDKYVLDTDASFSSVGAVLSQIQNGEEKVIAYASHKLTKSERNYCITRKELLAVYKYVLHFKHYLYGRRFLVRTDHQALTWLLNWDKPNTSQYCSWRAELESYDMEVVYRPGRLHANADALSRLPQCEQCEVKHDDPQKKRNVKITLTNVDEPEHVICKISTISSSWNEEKDEEIGPIIMLLKEGKVNEKYPKELESSNQVTKALWY